MKIIKMMKKVSTITEDKKTTFEIKKIKHKNKTIKNKENIIEQFLKTE